MKKNTIVELKSISHTYGGASTLEDVSISIGRGESVVLFGADDAGKTTLLHILTGLETKYGGDASLFGCRPDKLDDVGRGKVRYVPDNIIWEPGVTADRYLRYVRKASPAYDEELQHVLCAKYGIDVQEVLLEMTYQDNKLVQVIGAVCARPELLVLDEPANFLGKERYMQLKEDVKGWNKGGMALLTAAECYEDMKGCCGRYIYLRDGQVFAQGMVEPEDYRSKVVTVEGGDQEYLEGQMDACIMRGANRAAYLYKGRRLLEVLRRARCLDWIVEELTLAQELSEDYSRWEI